MDASELSSLRWLTNIKVPMEGLLIESPSGSASTTPGSTPNGSFSEQDSNHESPYLAVPSRRRKLKFTEKYRKPNCSYSCLIGMAMKASGRKSLPVCAIYKFIENEYPYYKTAPDGWKNSIRHNLSLNRAFRKVEQPEGMKKGCQWGLNPAREAFLESEVSRFLQEDDKSWEELCFKYGTAAGSSSPMYSDVVRSNQERQQYRKRASQLSTDSRSKQQQQPKQQPPKQQTLTVITSNDPLISSDDPLLGSSDITETITALQTVAAEEVVSTSDYCPPTKQPLDLNESPSKFTTCCPVVPQDDTGVAKSLFGLDLSPPKNYWNIYPCYDLYNQEYKTYVCHLDDKQASSDEDEDSTDEDVFNHQYIMRTMKQLRNKPEQLPDLMYFEQLSDQTSSVLQHQDVECVNEMQLDNMVLSISRDFLTSSPHRKLDVSKELKLM